VTKLMLVTLAALAFAPDAAAKCCALVTPVAPDLRAGEVWTAAIRVQGDRTYWRTYDRLTVIAWSEKPGKYFSAAARPAGRPEMYEARVVFPTPGVWSYAVTFGGFSGSASAPVRQVTVGPRRSDRPLELWLSLPVVAVGASVLILALRRRTA
jgi:hypothetical protein